jgi:hypothetical protein
MVDDSAPHKPPSMLSHSDKSKSCNICEISLINPAFLLLYIPLRVTDSNQIAERKISANGAQYLVLSQKQLPMSNRRIDCQSAKFRFTAHHIEFYHQSN